MFSVRDIKPRIGELIHGKQIEEVTRNDTVLVIRCTDGTEVRVAWVNDNGEAVHGHPAIMFAGRNVKAKTATLFGKGRSVG